MKALLYKDFVSAKSTYLLALVMILVIATYLTYHGAMVIISLLFVFMPVILNASSFVNETKSDFPKFAFTTPITRKAYVKSKYTVAVLFGIMALVSGFILVYLEYKSLNLALMIGALSFLLPILFSAIQIPFIIKFGEEKARLLVVAANFLLFAVASFLGDSFAGIIELIQNIRQVNAWVIAGLICAVTILILIVSQNIGVAIIKAKEY